MLQTVPATVYHDVDILVIGGEVDTMTACLALARADGWSMRSSSALPGALKRRKRPRLILLCDWDAVCAFTNRSPYCSRVWDTVVMAYCPPNPELTAEALDHGVDLVISYPCSPQLLARRLRAALRWTVR